MLESRPHSDRIYSVHDSKLMCSHMDIIVPYNFIPTTYTSRNLNGPGSSGAIFDDFRCLGNVEMYSINVIDCTVLGRQLL